MDPAGIPALTEAIKHLHGCEAKHVGTEHVKEIAPTKEIVWEGDVEIFAVTHEHAQHVYAWSEATSGTKRRFFAVLGKSPVTSATRAVQASMLAQAK